MKRRNLTVGYMYIWVILNLSPKHQYKKKHVFLSVIIPSPKKPKFIESFLFPGFHHPPAVQQEGLCIWDAWWSCEFVSRLFFFLGCIDGPGLTSLLNSVRHSGKHGCCMLCPLTGHHKPSRSQYYPVLLKPNNYEIPRCDHDDINPYNVWSISSAEYVWHPCYVLESFIRAVFKLPHLQTGIVGPSIILGLQLDHSRVFLIWNDAPQWCKHGIFLAWHFSGFYQVLSTVRQLPHMALGGSERQQHLENPWTAHCQLQAIPSWVIQCHSLWSEPSCNHMVEVNWMDWMATVYGVAPALLYHILPDNIWHNYCKFVAALHIMSQYSISPQ